MVGLSKRFYIEIELFLKPLQRSQNSTKKERVPHFHFKMQNPYFIYCLCRMITMQITDIPPFFYLLRHVLQLSQLHSPHLKAHGQSTQRLLASNLLLRHE